MGYSYQGVVLALERVQGLWGSRDEALLSAMLNHERSYVRYLLEPDDRKRALEDILRGARCTTFKPHHYGYAVEAFCFAVGEPVGEVDTRCERRAQALLRPSHALFMGEVDTRWPLPIPETTDYPLVAVLSPERCAAWEADLGARLAALPTPDPGDEDATRGHDALNAIIAMCAAASSTQRALFVFNH